MSKELKQKLVDTTRELVLNKSVDKITVKEIVSHKKKFLIVVTLIIMGMIIFFLFHISAKTELNYCKKIAYTINLLNLKCFKCETIKEKDSLILIHFTLKNKSRYSENEDLGIMDMARVKIYFENYLAKNPQSPLNQKNIDISFQTYADDSMHMYNYDYRDNTMKEVLYNKFLFFDELCAENLSPFQILCKLKNRHILSKGRTNFLPFTL